MSVADLKYKELCQRILEHGVWDKNTNVRPRWVTDGTPAYSKSIVSATLSFDNVEVPILTQKKIGWKTAIKEMLWIWREKTNSVDRLNEMGVGIWDEWKLEDGSIGKAYGYQLAKKSKKVKVDEILHEMFDRGYISGLKFSEDLKYAFLDQVDYLLYSLKTNPSSRRHITMLWSWDDIDDMSLTPCVYETQWVIQNNRLHLVVGVRSNDISVGNPFNVFQYYVLQRMIAQVTDYELGTLQFNINVPHIYERHIEGIERQLELSMYNAPTLWVNPERKNFYDFTIDDFKLVNYECGPRIEFEIAK